MAQRPTPVFRAEAVRLTFASGLSPPTWVSVARRGMVSCPRWGFTTLSRWIRQNRRKPEKPGPQSDLEREVARLRK